MYVQPYILTVLYMNGNETFCFLNGYKLYKIFKNCKITEICVYCITYSHVSLKIQFQFTSSHPPTKLTSIRRRTFHPNKSTFPKVNEISCLL